MRGRGVEGAVEQRVAQRLRLVALGEVLLRIGGVGGGEEPLRECRAGERLGDGLRSAAERRPQRREALRIARACADAPRLGDHCSGREPLPGQVGEGALHAPSVGVAQGEFGLGRGRRRRSTPTGAHRLDRAHPADALRARRIAGVRCGDTRTPGDCEQQREDTGRSTS